MKFGRRSVRMSHWKSLELQPAIRWNPDLSTGLKARRQANCLTEIRMHQDSRHAEWGRCRLRGATKFDAKKTASGAGVSLVHNALIDGTRTAGRRRATPVSAQYPNLWLADLVVERID